MILFFSASSDGLWSFDMDVNFCPWWDDMTALESPVLAIHTLSSITSITIAHDPDLSLTDTWFCLMKVSSASLNPLNNAFSGFNGKLY